MFLRTIDGDCLNQIMPPEKTPELFDKYLPYAVALDCELAWAQQFSAGSKAQGKPMVTHRTGMWGTVLSR